MPRFCRQCGAGNHAAAKFCEACGHAFASPDTSSPASAPSSSISPAKNKNSSALPWRVSSCSCLQAVCWPISSRPRRPRRRTSPRRSRRITATPRWQEPRAHQRLGQPHQPLDGLSGIYNNPQTVSGGWLSPPQYVFHLTEAGQQRGKGNRLCFADGIAVDAITDFTPPDTKIQTPMTLVQFSVTYVNPAEWTQNDGARELMPSVFGEDARVQLVLERHEGKWRVKGDL